MHVGKKGYEKNTKGGRTLINHKKLEKFVEIVTFFFSENSFFLQLFVDLSDHVVLLVPSKSMTLDRFFAYGWIFKELIEMTSEISLWKGIRFDVEKKSNIGNFWNHRAKGLRRRQRLRPRTSVKNRFLQKTIFAPFFGGYSEIFFSYFWQIKFFFANFCCKKLKGRFKGRFLDYDNLFSMIIWSGQLTKTLFDFIWPKTLFSSIFVFLKLKGVIQVMIFLVLWQLAQNGVWTIE